MLGKIMSTEKFEKRKKMILQLMQEDSYMPMKEKELAIFLQVKSEDREELKRVLDTLLSQGSIQIDKLRYI